MAGDLRAGILLRTEADGSAREVVGEDEVPGGRTVGIVSLGCPKNLVDSEVMLGRLRQSGFTLVSDAREAEVVVVNTCAFIDRAKQESVDAILEMAALKTSGRARRLVVTGCLAQRYDEEIRREIPEIDATLGTGQVEEIVRAVRGGDTSLSSDPLEWVYDHTTPRVLSTPPWLAYVKISEGCDYTCSFCIIPALRGRHRSRRPEDILEEASALAERGVREIVLVAQDTTRYGLDLGLRDALAPLLQRLGQIEGLVWIRVLYAYPSTLSDAVLDAMASEPKVVKYVDIPLQHASPTVLRRMKRPTERRHLLGMVERIRARVPGVAIRTSFIVGFPGETDGDFETLLSFVREARFESVGVFTYSDEEGTTAFGLPDSVPAAVRRRRMRRLMALQRRISARALRSRVGSRISVLVEGLHPDSDLLLRGRAAFQAPDIDGQVIISDGTAEAGSFVTAQVVESHDYDLVVHLV